MTPNEIYALDDLSEKPWYAFKNKKRSLDRLFPVLRDLSVDFDRAKADGNNRFSLCLKIRTPIGRNMPTGRNKDYTCWALMFDGRPFGFFTTYMYLNNRSFDVDVDIFMPYVYITDSNLWREAENLVCSYVNVDIPISVKLPLSLPMLDIDQTLVFQPYGAAPAIVDGMALVVHTNHRTQDGIVAFNASIYHRLLNELIEREGEEKLNQMKWASRSSIVKEMAHIGLLSVPKGIEARVGSGTVKTPYVGLQRLLAVLRFDSSTYGLTIEAGARLLDYKDSRSIMLPYLGTPDVFGSAHERMKWISEDPRRV